MRRETAFTETGMTPEERAAFLKAQLEATKKGKLRGGLAIGTGTDQEAKPGAFARGTGQHKTEDLRAEIDDDDDFDEPTQVDIIPAGLSTNDIFDGKTDIIPLTLEGIKAEDEIIGIAEGLDAVAALSVAKKKADTNSKINPPVKLASPADHKVAGLERRAKRIDEQLKFEDETRANMAEMRASIINPNKSEEEKAELEDLKKIRALIFQPENSVQVFDKEIRSGFKNTGDIQAGSVKSKEPAKMAAKEYKPETADVRNSRQMMENAIAAYIKMYTEYDPKSLNAIYSGKKTEADLVAAHDLSAISAPPLRAVFTSKGRKLRDFYNKTQQLIADYNKTVEESK